MTDVGGQAPGWYYAQGDPVGTQRYWDGTQWVGGPQTAQPTADVNSPAVGQVGYAAASSSTAASYGKRAAALIIDGIITLLVAVVVLVLVGLLLRFASVEADSAGPPLFAATGLSYFLFLMWNQVVRQGRTGQTVGKKMQKIKLVSDATSQPVGIGGAFLRQLVAGAIQAITCGIGGLLDYLWPLFDAEGKRLTDKVMKFQVVAA